jgi:hypothetical protein
VNLKLERLNMNRTKLSWTLGALLALAVATAGAGVLDPECTAEKAAKSAATKAAVGVGGRCDPKEAATDTAKDVANLDEKNDKDKKDKDKKDKDKD